MYILLSEDFYKTYTFNSAGKLESSPLCLRYMEYYLSFYSHMAVLTVALLYVRHIALPRTLSQPIEGSGDEYNAWFVNLFA